MIPPAKWVKNYSYITFRDDDVPSQANDKDIHVDDDPDYYTEKINPGMDKQALIDAGYTKLKVSFTFLMCEESQGNQGLYFACHWDPKGDTIKHWQWTSTASGWQWRFGEKDGKPIYETITINLTDEKIGSNCDFWTYYYAWGNGGDLWYLAGTRFIIEAVK